MKREAKYCNMTFNLISLKKKKKKGFDIAIDLEKFQYCHKSRKDLILS